MCSYPRKKGRQIALLQLAATSLSAGRGIIAACRLCSTATICRQLSIHATCPAKLMSSRKPIYGDLPPQLANINALTHLLPASARSRLQDSQFAHIHGFLCIPEDREFPLQQRLCPGCKTNLSMLGTKLTSLRSGY